MKKKSACHIDIICFKFLFFDHKDFYQLGEMPGLSYMTFGITWKLK